MGRRFELPIGPFLQRLGLVRPDESPVELADAASLQITASEAAWSARHPGQRVWSLAVTVGVVAGQTSAVYVTAPQGGAYWLGVRVQTNGLYCGTENEAGPFPALAGGGPNVQRTFRPDNREPLPALTVNAGAAVAVANVWDPLPAGLTLWPRPGFWFEGTRLCVAQGGPAAGLDVLFFFASPLEGMRR